MTIVNLGNHPLQVPESGSRHFVRELLGQIYPLIRQVITRCIEASLEAEMDRLLGRKAYRRRKTARRKETKLYCSQCRSHQRQDFRRNGHYARQLLVHWGRIQVQVPQAKCQCGGNVRLEFQTLRRRQRIWQDLKVHIQVEHGRGLSYRQIKGELEQWLSSSVGLRTLNRQVLELGTADRCFVLLKAGEAPPVVRVDGIWVTVMVNSGEVKTDRCGRQRAVKQAQKIPILVAQGVWPASGRTQLLAWMRAKGEDLDSWQLFLEGLYEAGLSSENGLRLLVADGGQGFRAAYENVYWQTPLQRCVFHKLRNLADALQSPAELDRPAVRQFRTEFLRSAARIWQAADETQARQLQQAFCDTWQTQQPKAIAKLKQDFDDTLTFFSVQEQAALRGEHWPARSLRTTSPLERMFREFRQRYRRAILFHSFAGLQAATAQLAQRFS